MAANTDSVTAQAKRALDSRTGDTDPDVGSGW
jgi:hypothetical protein